MATKADADDKTEAPAKGGPMKLLILIVPAVLMLAAGAFFFMHASSASATPAPVASPSPVPGAVKVVDPVSINLANGHYLKLGLALQATLAAGDTVDGSQAVDLAIALFSGKTIDELATKEGREKAKKTLIKEVDAAYDGAVYDIYYTTFVFQ